MKTRIIQFILAAMMSGTGFMANAQQKDSVSQRVSFTAKEAVDYALKNAVQVKNALLDIQSQAQTNKQYTASALPQIGVSGTATYNPNVTVTPIPDFISMATYGVLTKNKVQNGSTGQAIVSPNDFGILQLAFATKYAGNASVNFSQILFDGQVFVGLQARKTALKNATLLADITKEQIKANVYKIYYQLVVGQRQIGTFNANIATYEKLLHDTKEIYKNGFVEKLDVDKVQVQLINLQTQKLKAQNQIDAGKEGLKFLMNLPQNDELILTDTLSDETLKSDILEENFKYEDRKEYQQLETAIDLGKYNVKRYQLSKLPTVSLGASYGYNSQWETFNYFKGPYYSSSFIALRIAVPIFDGGAKNANMALAKIDLEKLNNSVSQLKSSIDNDVAQSRLNLKTALVTMDAQKRNIELAEQVYNSTKLKYEQGLGSNQEISTAQSDLITAQNNYYSSLYDAVIAKIDFLKAAGKL